MNWTAQEQDLCKSGHFAGDPECFLVFQGGLRAGLDILNLPFKIVVTIL